MRQLGSKTIMIPDETYNKLLRLKEGNESFNDVILRLISQKQDLLRFAGLLTDKENELLESALDEMGREMDEADQARDSSD